MTSWLFILMTSTLVVTHQPPVVSASSSITNIRIEKHFPSKEACMTFQSEDTKKHAHDAEVNRTVRSKVIREYESTVCVFDAGQS
jgi:hypothetical protein